MPPHKTYVELFAGSAKILFTKPPSPIEVINDLDSGLVNFFRVLRDPIKYLAAPETRWSHAIQPRGVHLLQEALGRVTLTTCSKPGPGLLRLGKLEMVSLIPAGPARHDPVGKRMAKNVRRWISTIEYLPEFHERLLGVQVENQDFRKIIPKFDSPDTWFYADPPYIWSTRSSGKYTHEMSDGDHVDLVDLLINLKGTCLLSGYPHSLYEPLELMGWQRDEFEVFCKSAKVIKCAGAGHKGTSPKRTECLWLNPHLQKALEKDWLYLEKAA